jgi:hypothetical protein
LAIILLFIIIIGVILSDIYCINKNKHQKQKLFDLGNEINYYEFSNNKDLIEGMGGKGCAWWTGHIASIMSIRDNTSGLEHCTAIENHKLACEGFWKELSGPIGCNYEGSGRKTYDENCKDRKFHCSIVTPSIGQKTGRETILQDENTILKQNLETTSNAFKRCIHDMQTINDTAELKYVTGVGGSSDILAQSIWWGDKDMSGTENMIAINNVNATAETPEAKNRFARYDFPTFYDYLHGTYLDVSSLLVEAIDEFISIKDTKWE